MNFFGANVLGNRDLVAGMTKRIKKEKIDFDEDKNVAMCYKETSSSSSSDSEEEIDRYAKWKYSEVII